MGSYTGQAVFGGTTDPVTGSWTNATSLNATVVSSDITGYGVVAASFVTSGTITQGTTIFEVSDDGGTTWWPIAGLQTGNNNQAPSFVLTGTSASFEFATGAYNLFRVRLNPVILGSGSVAIRLSAEAFPFLTAVAITGTTNVSITGTNAVTQSGTWNVTVNTPLPAGTNVIGHVITDSGSTTVVTGTVAVTQSTSPWVVSLTSTTITGTVAVTQSTSPWVSNVTQWASTALGTPQTFGTAPTGVVIGTSSDLYVAGTRARSNQTTTAAGVVDVNIVGSLGATNSVTNGTFMAITDNTTKVAIIAGTAALKTDMSSVAGTATSTAAAGVQKVGIVGGGGTSLETTAGVLDYNLKNVNNVAVNVGIGAAGTGTQRVSISSDSSINQTIGTAGFEKITDGTNTAAVKPASTASVATDPALVVTMSPNTISVPVTQAPASTSNTSAATWTSATALNTTITLINGTFNYDALIVTLNQGSTITGGQLTFEVSNDNSNWVSITGVNASQFGTFAENGIYFLTQSSYVSGFFNMTSWQYFRVRLSTVITGTGNVVIGYAAQSAGSPPVVVRQPHNFGRTFVSITMDQIVAPTTEALVTMTINKGGTVTTGTSYTVANGKTLRLQSVDAIVSSSSGTQPVKIRLRSAATVTATSPIVWATYFSATTSSLGNVTQTWPDGLEIASAQQLGISMLDTNLTSNGVTLTLVGYEF
jgi:hypothetical protein